MTITQHAYRVELKHWLESGEVVTTGIFYVAREVGILHSSKRTPHGSSATKQGSKNRTMLSCSCICRYLSSTYSAWIYYEMCDCVHTDIIHGYGHNIKRPNHCTRMQWQCSSNVEFFRLVFQG
jgi:hypothetical protein